MKTNKEWHYYPKFGSYFRLVAGMLMQCAGNRDGTREDNACLVEYLNADMQQIYRELQKIN